MTGQHRSGRPIACGSDQQQEDGRTDGFGGKAEIGALARRLPGNGELSQSAALNIAIGVFAAADKFRYAKIDNSSAGAAWRNALLLMQLHLYWWRSVAIRFRGGKSLGNFKIERPPRFPGSGHMRNFMFGGKR